VDTLAELLLMAAGVRKSQHEGGGDDNEDHA
jgi:hypothetical protein